MNVARWIKNHIQGSLLGKEEIRTILEMHPESLYSGQAFRCLVFSDKEKARKLSVIDDICFAGSIQGVKKYLDSTIRDGFVVVFEVTLDVAIDLVHLVNNVEELEAMRTLTRNEDEICAYSVKNEIVVYEGLISEFITLY